MGFYQLKTKQKIPATIEKVWDFISSPANLKEITPPHMGFEITSGKVDEKMYPGMIISYKVSPFLGLKLTWVTEITQVRDHSYFVDEQRMGPYSMWHHQHFIKPIEGGTLMQDIVSYRPPAGIFGRIANWLFIRRQLNEIFQYRTEAVNQRFGKFED